MGVSEGSLVSQLCCAVHLWDVRYVVRCIAQAVGEQRDPRILADSLVVSANATHEGARSSVICQPCCRIQPCLTHKQSPTTIVFNLIGCVGLPAVAFAGGAGGMCSTHVRWAHNSSDSRGHFPAASTSSSATLLFVLDVCVLQQALCLIRLCVFDNSSKVSLRSPCALRSP